MKRNDLCFFSKNTTKRNESGARVYFLFKSNLQQTPRMASSRQRSPSPVNYLKKNIKNCTCDKRASRRNAKFKWLLKIKTQRLNFNLVFIKFIHTFKTALRVVPEDSRIKKSEGPSRIKYHLRWNEVNIKRAAFYHSTEKQKLKWSTIISRPQRQKDDK